MPSTWQLQHVSEHFECRNCITYSPITICSHHVSDHNFYAVCKVSIFNELGFLYSYVICIKIMI